MYIPWLCRPQAVYKISIQICIWASYGEPCGLVTMFFRTFLVEGHTVWTTMWIHLKPTAILCLTMIFDIDTSVWNDWYQAPRYVLVDFPVSYNFLAIFHFNGNLVSCRFTLRQITEPSFSILPLDETTYHVHQIGTCTVGYEFDIEIFIPSNRKRRIVDFVELSSFYLQRVTRLWVYLLVYSIKEND